MADLFKDLVQHLRDKPSIRWTSNTPVASLWYQADTIPRDSFRRCPSSETGNNTPHFLGDWIEARYINFTHGGEVHQFIINTSSDSATITAGVGAYDQLHQVRGSTSVVEINPVYFLPHINSVEGVKAIVYYSESAILNGLVVYDEETGEDIALTGTALGYDYGAETITKVVSAFPKGYRIGDHYAKCEYMIVDDVWVEGSDDTHLNIVAVLKPDLAKIAEEFDDIKFPGVLADTGANFTYPYYDESKNIVWEFDVPDAGSYTKAPSGTTHPTLPDAVLINESFNRKGASGTVIRTYHTVAPESEQTKFSYAVSYECQDGANLAARYPLVTVKLNVLLDNFTPAQCGAACPITGASANGGSNAELDFEDGSLVLIEPPTLEPQNTVYGTVTMKYGKVPGWEKVRVDDNDQLCSIWIYERRVLASATKPARGSTYQGKTVWESSIDKVNCCVGKQTVIVADMPSTALTGYEFNHETGENEPITQQVVPVADVAAGIEDIQTDGTYTSARPLNCGFSLLTTRKASPFTTRTYDTVINYFWPRVLSFIEMMDWVLKDGGARYYPRIVFSRQAYNGPTQATIVETWSKTAPTPANVKIMQPTAVLYSCPMFSLNTGPCLHGSINVQCDTGSSDPKWGANAGSTRNTPATNYTDWPATLLIASPVRPAYGGFIIRTVTVKRPDTTV